MPRRKKKSTISRNKAKRKVGRPAIGHKLPGADERIHRIHPNVDPRKEYHEPEKEDYESLLPPPDDEASKLKFPPPKKHATFRKTWAGYIDTISRRENFNIGHLNALEILCDLYVEYEDLGKFVRKHGRSFKSVSRNGIVWRLYPEVVQLNKVQTQIAAYHRILGLNLKKDISGKSGGLDDDWS